MAWFALLVGMLVLSTLKAPAIALKTQAQALCKNHFREGNFYVWSYHEGSGKATTSWERYSVSAVDEIASVLTIDMASKFDPEEPYNTHHRMRFSLIDALSARNSKEDWTFEEFLFLNNGVWQPAPSFSNTQAFEEKFDIYEMSWQRPGVPQRTIDMPHFIGSGLNEVIVVQRPRLSYNRSWYVRDPVEHAGICARKHFGEEDDPDAFYFDLVEVGCSSDYSTNNVLEETV